MNEQEENKLLIKIAHMYYEEDMTQAQISKELNIYRTTISRMLKKTKTKGIVKVTINYQLAGYYHIERELKEKYNLHEVIVIPSSDDLTNNVILKQLGEACANFLGEVIQDHDVIGFSWGTTLASVVNNLSSSEKKNSICIPLVGGPAGILDSKYHVNTIVYTASSKLNGKSLMIDVPAVLESKELKDAIIKSKHYQKIEDMWKSLDIAVFGIGSLAITDTSNWHAFYGEIYGDKREYGLAVGDICSRFYDKNGNISRTDLDDRTVSIELNQLKHTRFSIGVAESIKKVPSILGALNGGYLNVLITTEDTAKALLLQV